MKPNYRIDVFSVPRDVPIAELERAHCEKCRYQISDALCAVFGSQEGQITVKCSRFKEKIEKGEVRDG